MWLGMWMTSCPEAMGWDSLWFWIKTVSWDSELDEASWFFGPGRGQWVCGLRGALARWLSQWVKGWRWTNSQYRKIVSLSPHDENLNLKKVIKVSYQYQESRQCFVFFGFLCVWTLWTFLHIRIFHALIYGYVTLQIIYIYIYNII